MGRRPIRLPRGGRPLFEPFSAGRAGPGASRRFSPAEIQLIARTVRRTPEVMVKVTGGATKAGGVAAHFTYISRHEELEIETDEGERITNREQQKERKR